MDFSLSLAVSNRQIRLNDQGLIRISLKTLLGKTINIVRQDNMVFNGVLKKVLENEIVLSNMRRKNMTFAFDTISELYIDSHT
jgi:ferredoxin-fold anticodon binding domain-containing protein